MRITRYVRLALEDVVQNVWDFVDAILLYAYTETDIFWFF